MPPGIHILPMNNLPDQRRLAAINARLMLFAWLIGDYLSSTVYMLFHEAPGQWEY